MRQPLDTSSLLLSDNLPVDIELVRTKRFVHIPGQAAAIRFFDPDSPTDFASMQAIMRGKGTRKWMEDVRQLTLRDYREWADSQDTLDYLFSAHDARTPSAGDLSIKGFVYFYSEFRERRRVQRMIDAGMVLPSAGQEYLLEVSFAALPDPSGNQSGSGLMSSATRQACLEMSLLLKPSVLSDLLIFAFVDQDNIASHHTLEASGFIRRGTMKYDYDSYDENYVYTLDWPLLEEKIKSKLP